MDDVHEQTGHNLGPKGVQPAERVVKVDMPRQSLALKADLVVRCVNWSRPIQAGRDFDKPIQPAGLCPGRSVVFWRTMSCVLVGLALGVLALSLPGWSLGGAGALRTIWISAGGSVGSLGPFLGSRWIGNTR